MTAAARADDGTTSTAPSAPAPEATVETSAPTNDAAGSPGARETPGSVTVTIVVTTPSETPALATGQSAEGQPAGEETVAGSPIGTPQDDARQNEASATEQSNREQANPEQSNPEQANPEQSNPEQPNPEQSDTAGPVEDEEETEDEEPLVVPESSLVGSNQEATATSFSVQTDPFNGSVTVQIGVAGNTVAVTQSNTAAAIANAGTALATEPTVAGTTPVVPSTQGGSSVSTQTDQSSATAESAPSVPQETDSAADPTTPETNGQGQSQKPKGQKADASSSVHQSGAKNKKVGVRVASPGDDGSVSQTNSASATATSAGDMDDSFAATTSAEATQIAPSNTNLNIRVGSPGDNGAVTQSNEASATATTTGASGDVADTATATQIAPTNINVSLRISSPGADGIVTQTNSAVQTTTITGPVSIGAMTGAGNSNIAIALGDAGLVPPDAASAWNWNWAWEWADGQSGMPTPDVMASEFAAWDWSWGMPPGFAPTGGVDATAATSSQTPVDGSGPTGAASDPAAVDGSWTWTWTWTWQQDDQSNWSWEWQWSSPCECSWDWNWNWNWDWRTGETDPTGASTEIPTTLTDPSIANAVAAQAGLPDVEQASSDVLPVSTFETLVGPLVQSNESTASAEADSDSHVTRITATLPDAPVSQTTAEDQVAEATATSTQTAPTNLAVVTRKAPLDAESSSGGGAERDAGQRRGGRRSRGQPQRRDPDRLAGPAHR